MRHETEQRHLKEEQHHLEDAVLLHLEERRHQQEERKHLVEETQFHHTEMPGIKV